MFSMNALLHAGLAARGPKEIPPFSLGWHTADGEVGAPGITFKFIITSVEQQQRYRTVHIHNAPLLSMHSYANFISTI